MYTEINTKYRIYISNWLLIMFILISAMIVVGGLTRLTDSGLSITEWEFFKGFFPPINNDAWIAYFEAYKQIPEFKFQNYSMTLSEFKVIFWWEWAHRFFGRVIGLSFFIPLIMATAGNVGIQSSSIVIQTLSTPSPFEISVAERLTKVILVSILNGIVLSILVYSGLMLFDYLNFLDFEIFSKTAKIVSVSLFSIVLVSSLLGTLTPIVLNKLKFNPALASGPFITTTNDLMALAIYFIVAIAMGGI